MNNYILIAVVFVLVGYIAGDILPELSQQYKENKFMESLEKNKECIDILLAVNGKSTMAHECNKKLFFIADHKMIEIDQDN